MKYFPFISSLLTLLPLRSTGFLSGDGSSRSTHAVLCSAPASSRNTLQATNDVFQIELAVPPTSSRVIARLKFASVLSVPSEIVQIRYKLPFGLDIAPEKNLAVCTKDGAGGEKVGDVLRYTSQWTMGLPGGEGLAATAAFTGLGPSWQCSMFDVMKAKNWEQVVAALTSNVVSRTDEIVLVFERPLEPAPELQT